MSNEQIDGLYEIALRLESIGEHAMAKAVRDAARELIEARGINRLLMDMLQDDAMPGELLGDAEQLETLQ